MAAGLALYAPDGSTIVDTTWNVGLVLGSRVIGGPDQTQNGSFSDAKLALGNPFFSITSIEVNSFIGYKPIITISGTTVSWYFPTNYGQNNYPRTRFVYGLR